MQLVLGWAGLQLRWSWAGAAAGLGCSWAGAAGGGCCAHAWALPCQKMLRSAESAQRSLPRP
jgi:hypothetical protein